MCPSAHAPKRNHSNEKPRHTTIEWPPLSTKNSLQSNEDTAHPKINKYNDFKAIQSKIGCNWPIPSTITWEAYWIFCRQNTEIITHCAIGIVGSSPYSAESTVEMYQWGPRSCLLSLSPSQFGLWIGPYEPADDVCPSLSAHYMLTGPGVPCPQHLLASSRPVSSVLLH